MKKLLVPALVGSLLLNVVLAIRVRSPAAGPEITSFEARFEVLPQPDSISQDRLAFTLRLKGREFEWERVEGDKVLRHNLSSADTVLLLEDLRQVNLPRIDYQAHFDALEKRAAESDRLKLIPIHGSTVETEILINGTRAKFVVFSPRAFLVNHAQDPVVQSLKQCTDIIAATLGRSHIYYQ